MAVRNDKEGFFLCQAHQNIHRASKKIKIQWLSENEKSKNAKGDIYIKEFYDTIGKSAEMGKRHGTLEASAPPKPVVLGSNLGSNVG